MLDSLISGTHLFSWRGVVITHDIYNLIKSVTSGCMLYVQLVHFSMKVISDGQHVMLILFLVVFSVLFFCIYSESLLRKIVKEQRKIASLKGNSR